MVKHQGFTKAEIGVEVVFPREARYKSWGCLRHKLIWNKKNLEYFM